MFQHGETRDWLGLSEFLRTVVTGVVSPGASTLSTAVLRESLAFRTYGAPDFLRNLSQPSRTGLISAAPPALIQRKTRISFLLGLVASVPHAQRQRRETR